MPQPLLHFICGSTGAGKTTYAMRLARELNGVRFAVDEWMQPLFWDDAEPDVSDPGWAIERIGRCAALIWQTALDVAATGTPVLLELGFTTRTTRQRYADEARRAGHAVRLHLLDVPREERWRRVAARNAGASGPLGFAVTREMFDYVEREWEAPDADELAALDGVRV